MKWQENSLTTVVNELLGLDEITQGEAKKLNAIKKSFDTPPAYPITVYDAEAVIELGRRYLSPKEKFVESNRNALNQILQSDGRK